MRRVDRYVLGELLLPFVAGVGFFLVLIAGLDLMSRVFRLLIHHHFPLVRVLLFVAYSTPRLVGYVLPMAVMFATLSAVGRLSSDSELDAINAGGIGFQRMSASIVVFGIAITGVTFVLNEVVAPVGNKAATALVTEHVQKKAAGRYFILSLPDQKKGLPLKWLITAAACDPARRHLTNVAIIEFQRGQPATYFEAPEARWVGTKLRAKVTFTERKPGDSTLRISGTPEIDMGVPEALAMVGETKPQDLTLTELREMVDTLQSAAEGRTEEVLDYLAEYHVRIAGPFCALAFALIGAPLGVRPSRSTTGLNLGMSMVIVFLYFVFSYTTTAMAKGGQLEPWIAAWTGNVVLFFTGGYLFWRVFR
jgi:lipopolysaccharide export system permease protein